MNEVQAMVVITIASALEFYARTGMQVNRAYTPTKMIAKARELTGNRKLRARDYTGAAAALRDLVK